MAFEGYYEMQLNFVGSNQRFIFHPPGLRTSKAVLASVRFLPANFRNRFVTETSVLPNVRAGRLLITSPWGEVAPMLRQACAHEELLREARFDFWDTSESFHKPFTIHIFNTRVLASGVSDPWSGIPSGADAVISKDPGYKWQTFSFTVPALRAQGTVPLELSPLLHLSR
jgi:hypothetical protein